MEETRNTATYIGSFFEGLAIARDGAGWFHVNENYEPVYQFRYEVTGKFSEGLAVAKQNGAFFHIRTDGQGFKAAKRFSEGLAAVVDTTGAYHILPNGQPAYQARFKEVSCFKNGLASAKGHDGSHFWINKNGEKD